MHAAQAMEKQVVGVTIISKSNVMYPGLLFFPAFSSISPLLCFNGKPLLHYKAFAMHGESSFHSFPHPSSASLAEMVAMHNPIQLAAISNYKLAQLTFAPPNVDSLRKTALVKNMLEILYRDTPAEWLNQMTRWVFFTPE